jgi:GNAT superfamily N-acetyltransferase
MQDDVARVRTLAPEDWPSVARLLGRPGVDGARLSSHVEAVYRPWFGSVLPARSSGDVDAAVVAGVRKRTTTGAPAAVTLVWVGVTPARRRQGIGRGLVEGVAAFAMNAGTRRVELTTDLADVATTAFFTRCGFETERQTLHARLDGSAAEAISSVPAPPGVVVRTLGVDDVPALTGLLIHLAVERAVEPHDDLDGVTPSVLAAAAMNLDFVAAAAWESDDPSSPLGLAWGARRADGVHLHFVGVHDDARRRGIGRALVGMVLSSGRKPALLARVHEPAPVHGFFARIGGVAVAQTLDLVRVVGAEEGATLES